MARESGRIKDACQKRILDDAARKRRQKKALEALEQDNFHDDPHADLVMSKKVPKFQETLDNRSGSRKKKTRSAEYYKQRFRKTFAQLVEEDMNINPNPPNYACAQAPPSYLPERHFCALNPEVEFIMSLYDDFDKHRTTEKVAGWSSGIKLLQSQLQLKKAATTQPKREQYRKATAILAPVIDLKSKTNRDVDREDDNGHNNPLSSGSVGSIGIGGEFDWNVVNEYDPIWPNEYEKVVKELRDIRDREHDQETEMRKRRRDNTRLEDTQPAGGNSTMIPPERDEERTPTSRAVVGGAAIAPPPSLQESTELPPPPPRQPSNLGYSTSSVAAKIMAKYGFKEGQGLGKKEQGMSVALQVEKTSKRGGRIVGEREQLMPPPSPLTASPPLMQLPPQSQQSQEEPSITEIMKCPSKVVLLRNMVGPGEVDDDLEPEVKDECNTKYGDVARVLIHEVIEASPEEAVRIFVEFKRIESAIKAVVDLNGRFFGGRQVKAGFYSSEKLDNLQLMD